MKKTGWTTVIRLAAESRSYWPHLAAIFLLSALGTPLALLAPVPLKLVIDNVVGSRPLSPIFAFFLPRFMTGSPEALLLLAAGMIVAIALITQLRGLLSWILQTQAGESMVLDFRTRLFAHVQSLSIGYHDEKGAADSTFRIQYDAPALQYVMVNGLIPLITSVLTVIGIIAITLSIDWQLAIVPLAVTPILYVLTRRFSTRLRQRWKQVKLLESGANASIQEVLSSIRVVKAYVQENEEHRRFRDKSSLRMYELVQVSWLQGWFDLAVAVTIAVGTALTLYVGVKHVQNGVLTLGSLVLLLAYVAQLFDPLQQVSKKLTDLQGSLVSAERAYALLDESPDVRERPHAIPITRAQGRITFRDVSFAYEEASPVLKSVTLDVKPGMRVGIQGQTGAGKSTLMSLMIRFHDVTSGAICLDGIDIREYRLQDLRNQFSIVLQDSVLFSTSIAENIAYGRRGATREEVVEAARLANAHDFIMALGDGYDTVVGERGMKLSGGERQRVALARAFLKDAPILILDEPTSSVDVGTEFAIMEALDRLMHGRTTFMIAHRLSTLDTCDIRLEMRQGQLSVLEAVGAPI